MLQFVGRGERSLETGDSEMRLATDARPDRVQAWVLCNGWPGVVLVLQALRPQILGAIVDAYAESDTIIKVPKEEEVRGRRSALVWRSCAGAP